MARGFGLCARWPLRRWRPRGWPCGRGGRRDAACATSGKRPRARVRRAVGCLERACCYHSGILSAGPRQQPAAAVTGLQQFLQQQPSRFRGPFEVLRRCGTGVLCLLASPALLSSLLTIPRRPWSAPCASCCPRARCTSATRSGLFPKNPAHPNPQTPTPNSNHITLILTLTSPCRPNSESLPSTGALLLCQLLASPCPSPLPRVPPAATPTQPQPGSRARDRRPEGPSCRGA